MSDVKLFEFQQRILDDTAHRNPIPCGKTFIP